MANLEELLTIAGAAARVGLKPAALRTEIKRGRLTPTIIAGKHYVTNSALGEMLERCRAAPKDQAGKATNGCFGSKGSGVRISPLRPMISRG
jgi:hypothetical protein